MSKELRRGDLPVHFRTGLTAVGIVNGRPVWPIMGGAGNAEAAVADALRDHDQKLQTSRSAILELGEKAELTEDESKRFEELEKEYTGLQETRKPLAERAERMAKIREQFEAGDGLEGPEGTEGTSRSDGTDDETVTSRSSASNSAAARGRRSTKRTDPYKDYATTRSMPVGDVVTRARQSLEQVPEHELTDTQRAHVDRALRGDRKGTLARHIMAGQNPDYVSAFEKIMGGDVQLLSLTESERSAVAFTDEVKRGILEGTGSAGGFLVPPYFDPTVIHTQEDSVNPIRQLVSQRTINGPKWTGVSMGGVSAGYVGEAVEIGESVPAFGAPTITVQKAGAYLKASTEALEDSSVGSEMAGLLQESKDEWEAHEFLLGDGATGHIRGMIPALVAADAAASAGSKLIIATAAAGVYTADDIYNLIGLVPPRYRRNAQWMAEFNFYLRARRLANNNNIGAFWTDLNGDNPPKIVGKSTNEVSQMATSPVGTNYTAGQIVALVGDFQSFYRIIDRRGMVIEFDPLVKGPNGRPTGERGWYATWRTGGDTILPRAVRGLKSA